eukprot:149498-Chlamydomonas_euryale.AAC.1
MAPSVEWLALETTLLAGGVPIREGVRFKGVGKGEAQRCGEGWGSKRAPKAGSGVEICVGRLRSGWGEALGLRMGVGGVGSAGGAGGR